MASLVVGLFEQRSDAESALTDLVNNNFDRAHINLKEAYPEDAQHSLARLRHELEGEGVPESDAKLYEEGVRAGDILAAAHTSDDQAELAREIMNRHGALDIHDASMQRVGSAAGLSSAMTERNDAIGKREIQRGGVRIFQRTEERPVEEVEDITENANKRN
jgi:hypothetical protein